MLIAVVFPGFVGYGDGIRKTAWDLGSCVLHKKEGQHLAGGFLTDALAPVNALQQFSAVLHRCGVAAAQSHRLCTGRRKSVQHSGFLIALAPKETVDHPCPCIKLHGRSLKPYHLIEGFIVAEGYHVLCQCIQLVQNGIAEGFCFQDCSLLHTETIHIFIAGCHDKCLDHAR